MPNAVRQPRQTASQRGTTGVYGRPVSIEWVGLEPALAALVTLVGIALTLFGVFTHTGPAIAPGALLAMVGGVWLGNSLARRGARLLPGTQIVQPQTREP